MEDESMNERNDKKRVMTEKTDISMTGGKVLKVTKMYIIDRNV